MNICTDGTRASSQTRSDLAVQHERIIYLTSFTDAAVRKRAHAFLAGGHELLSFSFRRDRYNVGVGADWPNVEMGTSTERRLVTRILLCFTSVLAIFRHRRQWRDATLIYARNLDLALLAIIGKWITWCRAPLIYEVLDVHQMMAASTAWGAILRWLERRVLARCRLLVVSSPGFLREYFRPRQAFSGQALLLENKWSRESVFSDRPHLNYHLTEPDPVWTIGWFGNLRCPQSLEILTALADALPDRVRIYLRGCDSLLAEDAIPLATDGRSNMFFAGEYNAPDDLLQIYSKVHFNWCADFSDGDNSRWLIPNRIYEGGYFAVPALAMCRHETGRIVSERGLGLTFDVPCLNHLTEILGTLGNDEYRNLRSKIQALDVSQFVELRDTASLIRSQIAAP